MYQEIFIHITAGRGPEECARVVYHCITKIRQELQALGLVTHIEHTVEARNPDSIKSALLLVKGLQVEKHLKAWEGTIQWIAQSPFRKYHKRKNWFIGVSLIAIPKHIEMPKRLEIKAFKASGPGGQHRNKVSSAIRVTDLDSGLSVTATESRSQHQNKALALQRLHQLFTDEYVKIQQRKLEEQWEKTLAIVRGNPIKVFREKL